MFIFGSTLFVADFMQNLFDKYDEMTLISWLQDNFQKTKEYCLRRARDQLKRLDSVNHSAGTTTSRGVIHFLYTVQRICGGTYQITDGTDLSNIVGQGVARIYDSQDRFRLADPVFVDALFEYCKGNDDIIINQLSA